MDQQQIDRLTTLGHAGRMALYRLLVRRYPDFVASGELADHPETGWAQPAVPV